MDFSRLLSPNSVGKTPDSFPSMREAAQWLVDEIKQDDPTSFTHIYCIQHNQWEEIVSPSFLTGMLTVLHTQLNTHGIFHDRMKWYPLTLPCGLGSYLITYGPDLHFHLPLALGIPIQLKILKRSEN